MSRAFVKEPDGDAVQDDTPDIPISPHPNYVTATGLRQLEQQRDDLVAERAALKAGPDPVAVKLALFPVERRLRYILARLDSAILKCPVQTETVAVGHAVLVADDAGEEQRYWIVGEDEADIKAYKVSWVSPLARALIDREVGDLVKWRRPAGDRELEILEISLPGGA
ncbi:GreA/GreB family elongation factor [Aestuariispira insulae]|uniref:Transcription elongation GreA/GreB family factor n=1 Tax=Aestuariispira insulae TaxID=1461337 RepID=A0A3D9HS14_9PROT|nr:GreA/GreB family elongation factor [Aestuariispira insulae]RED52249.1 transcription elongation GreA/GreB family factor [Aestuariispira insulae]